MWWLHDTSLWWRVSLSLSLSLSLFLSLLLCNIWFHFFFFGVFTSLMLHFNSTVSRGYKSVSLCRSYAQDIIVKVLFCVCESSLTEIDEYALQLQQYASYMYTVFTKNGLKIYVRCIYRNGLQICVHCIYKNGLNIYAHYLQKWAADIYVHTVLAKTGWRYAKKEENELHYIGKLNRFVIALCMDVSCCITNSYTEIILVFCCSCHYIIIIIKCVQFSQRCHKSAWRWGDLFFIEDIDAHLNMKYALCLPYPILRSVGRSIFLFKV